MNSMGETPIHAGLRIALLALALCSAAGCAMRGAVQPQPPAEAAAPPSASRPSDALLWARTSAEHHAAYMQGFKAATRRVEIATRKVVKPWAVILDVDETILDNSQFEVDQAGKPFDPQAFDTWCAREEAVALPGSREFLRRIRQLGGRIVLVTNRSQASCDHTRSNLGKQDLPFDEVLCKADTDDKNGRFQAVQLGTSPSTLPPLSVVLWVGDNIQDFPGMTQKALRDAPDSAFVEFGDKYIVLPNPMYGSWTSNPMR
jgi:5'-nucleotidase (lipoprotein e(P4) family)